MVLSDNDIKKVFCESLCFKRVQLETSFSEKAPMPPFKQTVLTLAKDYRDQQLAALPERLDMGVGPPDKRAAFTRRTVADKEAVIVKGLLKAHLVINGSMHEVYAQPDVLLRDGKSYIIRLITICRRVNHNEHPELEVLASLNGLVFEKEFGLRPSRIELLTGTGDLVTLNYDGGEAALECLEKLVAYRSLEKEPYEPVGWSKCLNCPYREHCWTAAEANKEIGLIPSVDQGLAEACSQIGVRTMEQFLKHFTAESLADFCRPWVRQERRVGAKKASRIMSETQVMLSGKPMLRHKPQIVESDNYVMFDLEGLPPLIDQQDQVFLWGMQVFGSRPGKYVPAVAGFGDNGDYEGWHKFLMNAKAIFEEYGDLPFVHWHFYEKKKIDLYMSQYGDIDSIAQRVKDNLFDLLPVVHEAIILPIPSYSLKVLEKYIGFKRTQDEYGGDWAMAKYMQAIDTNDEDVRSSLVAEICTYNQEDLQATWAVLIWSKSFSECLNKGGKDES